MFSPESHSPGEPLEKLMESIVHSAGDNLTIPNTAPHANLSILIITRLNSPMQQKSALDRIVTFLEA
jgi:hypothetical protein